MHAVFPAVISGEDHPWHGYTWRNGQESNLAAFAFAERRPSKGPPFRRCSPAVLPPELRMKLIREAGFEPAFCWHLRRIGQRPQGRLSQFSRPKEERKQRHSWTRIVLREPAGCDRYPAGARSFPPSRQRQSLPTCWDAAYYATRLRGIIWRCASGSRNCCPPAAPRSGCRTQAAARSQRHQYPAPG